MSIPNIYRGIGETQIASYNYNDIANGTGIITFYGGKCTDNPASQAFILANNPFYSKEVYTYCSTLTDYSTAALHLNFEVMMNLPRIIEGDAVLNIPIGQKTKAAGGGTQGIFPWIIFKKKSGNTETTLAQASGTIFSKVFAGGETWQAMDVIKAKIPKTKFRTGDTLRMIVDLYNKTTGQSYGYIAHDPKNRASGAFEVITGESIFSFDMIDSNLIANIPFVIDL